MISNLHIERLGIIEEADIELSPGMVAFTGETGAGKTMLTHALGLVLGDRADHNLVGTETARVEARFRVGESSRVAEIVREAGGELDDGELIAARVLSPSGRSKAFAGGRSVPTATLAELAKVMTSRHGQNDQIHLRKPARQREALDRFAGDRVRQPLAEYRRNYADFVALSKELSQWQEKQRLLAREAALLQQSLTEIEIADPRADELDELNVEIARLSNAEAIREATTRARTLLSGSDRSDNTSGGSGAVAQALVELQRVSQVEPTLAGVVTILKEAQNLLAEATGELSVLAPGSGGDESRLNALQQRKADLTSLCRKYGDSLTDVLKWAADASEKLAELDPDGVAQSDKRIELEALTQTLTKSGLEVSRARVDAAKKLAESVTGELHSLSMPTAEFMVCVEHREDPGGLPISDGQVVSFGENGLDVIAFQLQPHPGSAPTPLGEGASGGELSRLMLALEVVLASSSAPQIFVFDEIDAGVGGRAAVEVGRRLARLASRSQVLVVTHLPQVASFAEQQIVVQKDATGLVTRTSISESSGSERVQELSRMLSGLDDSQSGQTHAEELLDLAAFERAAHE